MMSIIIDALGIVPKGLVRELDFGTVLKNLEKRLKEQKIPERIETI